MEKQSNMDDGGGEVVLKPTSNSKNKSKGKECFLDQR